MKAAGIVAEFNPFHNGHMRHIARTRTAAGSGTPVICVMSGNFTQRGEPAVFEKHARAEAAVLCGADLVLELPLSFSLSSAEGFCFGAVALLEMLGCVEYLSFGSESGDINGLRRIARALAREETSRLIGEGVKSGISYAAARQAAAEALCGSEASLLSKPNNILGVEYLKAIERLGSGMKPLTFGRLGVGHDDTEIRDGLASASRIREIIREGGDFQALVPAPAYEVFERELENGFAPVLTENIETAVLAKLRTMSSGDFNALPDASGELTARLMRYARSETNVESLIGKTATKRYARSRIRRMVMCAFLGIKADTKPERPMYARVLAIGDDGREILKTLRGKPVIVKPASAKSLDSEASAQFELEARSTDLYALAYPEEENRQGGQEWIISPSAGTCDERRRSEK